MCIRDSSPIAVVAELSGCRSTRGHPFDKHQVSSSKFPETDAAYDAAQEQATGFHGQLWARAHLSTCKQAPSTALKHVDWSHGQPCSLHHRRRIKSPLPAASGQVFVPQGAPFSRAHLSTPNCPNCREGEALRYRRPELRQQHHANKHKTKGTNSNNCCHL